MTLEESVDTSTISSNGIAKVSIPVVLMVLLVLSFMFFLSLPDVTSVSSSSSSVRTVIVVASLLVTVGVVLVVIILLSHTDSRTVENIDYVFMLKNNSLVTSTNENKNLF